MALGGIYETGTVTIAVDRVSVTGVGTLWSPIVEVGDWLFVNGQVGLVALVTDDTHLVLETQWQGTLPAAAVYVVIKMSWLRYDPALTQSKLRELLEELEEQGNFLFTSVSPPDPAMGVDGQWALRTDVSPWQLWYKTGGIWVEQAAPAGLKWLATWSAATTYKPADAVERLGSSFVSKTTNTNQPPETNADDWDLMAAKGATGSTGSTGPAGMIWRGNWSSGTNYAINDAVNDLGTSYIAIAASGPANGGAQQPPGAKWNTLAQGGTATIADSQIDPIKLNADNPAETLLFHNRLGTVAYDGAQTLTAAQQVQARKNVYAAPLDALAFNGIQVNGSMDVAQQYAGTPIGGNGYPVDQWQMVVSHATWVASSYQAAGGPAGFSYFLVNAVTTGGAVSAVGDVYSVHQPIEASRFKNASQFGTALARPITVGFWAFPSAAGLFPVALRNAAGNRTMVKTVSLAANLWQWKTVTFDPDTTGIWPTSGHCATLLFTLASGSNHHAASLDTWNNDIKQSHASCANFVSSNGFTVWITGVVILPGAHAPPAEYAPNLMRPIDQEMVACLRYFRRIGGNPGSQNVFLDGVSTGAGNQVTMVLLHPGMRTTPTWAVTGGVTAVNCSGPTFVPGFDTTTMYISPLGVGRFYWFNNAGTYLTANARLI